MTQSIHKEMLSAMRQAQMIHMLGPKYFLDNRALEELVRSHTTTSPMVPFSQPRSDVAPMGQVQVDGCLLSVLHLQMFYCVSDSGLAFE